MSGIIMIESVHPEELENGKFLSMLAKLQMKLGKNEIACSKKLLALRQYGYRHRIYRAKVDNEVVGLLVWHRDMEERHEAPPREIIVIDTLCATNKEVESELMKQVPVLTYSTGASPATIPPGYTNWYNETLEGDPMGLLLPPLALNENTNKPRSTNFKKKTSGPSAIFPKLTVKTRRQRRKSRRARGGQALPYGPLPPK